MTGAANLSLFGERRLIELRLAGPIDTTAARSLTELAERPPADTLLLVSGELERKSLQAAWVQAFEQAAVLVLTRPVNRDELPRWISARLAERGVTLDAPASRLLADRVEGNLLAAQQEIERIALAWPGGSLDEATVASLVTDSARYDVFELATAAFAGEAARALRILAGLRAEGQEPPLLLWALLSDLRALSRVALRLTRTRSIDEAFRAERVWASRQPALRVALPRLSRPTIDALIVAAGQADRMAKGALARRSMARARGAGGAHRGSTPGRMMRRSASSAALSTRSTSGTCARRSRCCRRCVSRRSVSSRREPRRSGIRHSPMHVCGSRWCARRSTVRPDSSSTTARCGARARRTRCSRSPSCGANIPTVRSA